MLILLLGVILIKFGLVIILFFGVQLVLLDSVIGVEIDEIVVEGVLVIKDSWFGQMCMVWGDYEWFMNIYFVDYKGYYFLGDGCCCDVDGYYWIIGCVDDVINVFGYCMGMVEVESVLVVYVVVVEVVVVGYLYDIKGQGIYCYVILMNGVDLLDDLIKEL